MTYHNQWIACWCLPPSHPMNHSDSFSIQSYYIRGNEGLSDSTSRIIPERLRDSRSRNTVSSQIWRKAKPTTFSTGPLWSMLCGRESYPKFAAHLLEMGNPALLELLVYSPIHILRLPFSVHKKASSVKKKTYQVSYRASAEKRITQNVNAGEKSKYFRLAKSAWKISEKGRLVTRNAYA